MQCTRKALYNGPVDLNGLPFIPQFVKDIRRLVDSGDFIANKHCSSPVVKLIVTLLLELITDHSREVGC